MPYHTNDELLTEVTRGARGAGTRACIETAGTTVEGRSILSVRVAAPGRAHHSSPPLHILGAGRKACGRAVTVSFDGLRRSIEHLVGRQAFFPHQMSFILELPFRAFLITPSQLADRLHLTPRSKVLEVSCGSGIFSVEVARRLPHGHLELFDLQPEMLAKARQKVEAASLTRVVGYTQGDARELAFATAGFDVAFLVAVLGEVPEPHKCLAALARVIRPGGLLSITEHLPDPDFSRLSTLRTLVEPAGFKFVECFGPPWSYTANFRRPRKTRRAHHEQPGVVP